MFNLRCQQILNSKKYSLDDNPQSSIWKITGLATRLSLYYTKDVSEQANLCREALALLLNNRASNRAWEITFKEFENYLRDDNLTPAFNISLEEEIEANFKLAKEQILMAIFEHLFLPNSEFESHTYLGKIRLGLIVNENLKQIFGAEFNIKIAQIEHEYVYYQEGKDSIREEFITFVEKIFSFVFKDDIKLVAVKA